MKKLSQTFLKFFIEWLARLRDFEITTIPGTREKNQIEGDQNQPLDSSQLSQKVSECVALCLVVPASALGKIQENHPINVSDIATLIENASYFICTTPEDANTIQQRLRLTKENITNVSEKREFYVRINIDDGEEMRDKRVPYILKRNLPSNGQGIVTQLACLEYLSVSGLENFNRI